jgi:hypothetical protein
MPALHRRRTGCADSGVLAPSARHHEIVDPDGVAALEANLRYLLNHWDPIGIYDPDLDVPPDEYDCLIAPVLTRLVRGDGVAEMSEFLWFELEDHFGLNPTNLGSDDFAAKLVAWYRAAVG